MNKTKRKFTAEFKEQALGLMSLGKPVAEVARDLEVGVNLAAAKPKLARW